MKIAIVLLIVVASFGAGTAFGYVFGGKDHTPRLEAVQHHQAADNKNNPRY